MGECGRDQFLVHPKFACGEEVAVSDELHLALSYGTLGKFTGSRVFGAELSLWRFIRLRTGGLRLYAMPLSARHWHLKIGAPNRQATARCPQAKRSLSRCVSGDYSG